jgi:threonine dehydrogenase-like Zn-dependent dehydrogenase
VHPGGLCGECYYCRSSLSNLCAEQLGVGYRVQGAYAEYVTLKADQTLPLPDAGVLKLAALTEPFAVALRAVKRGALQQGETVFIAGGGPIGLLTLLAARLKGAAAVDISQPATSRRDLALRLGADHVLDSKDLAPVWVRKLTGGLRCDLAVECVGSALAMNDCLAATRRGGRVVLPAPSGRHTRSTCSTCSSRNRPFSAPSVMSRSFARRPTLSPPGPLTFRP